MKKSLIYLMAGLLFLSSCNKPESLVKRKEIFNYHDHEKQELNSGLVNLNGNDYLEVKYDLNNNGNKNPDALAYYPFFRGPSSFIIIYNASFVYVDADENGNEEYILWDKNKDGMLEKKIKRKNKKSKKSKETSGVLV